MFEGWAHTSGGVHVGLLVLAVAHDPLPHALLLHRPADLGEHGAGELALLLPTYRAEWGKTLCKKVIHLPHCWVGRQPRSNGMYEMPHHHK